MLPTDLVSRVTPKQDLYSLQCEHGAEGGEVATVNAVKPRAHTPPGPICSQIQSAREWVSVSLPPRHSATCPVIQTCTR
jgi:hypothetical protein